MSRGMTNNSTRINAMDFAIQEIRFGIDQIEDAVVALDDAHLPREQEVLKEALKGLKGVKDSLYQKIHSNRGEE